jgi:hypothetical protein
MSDAELASALVHFQAEVTAVPKDATNPFFKSKYADLPAVVKHAGPHLAKNGLAVSQLIGFNGEHDTLTTLLIHASGQQLQSTMRLHLAKDDPQGQGSAVTYARRYSYMAILGLVADEDDDGNAATAARRAHPTGQQTRPSPRSVSIAEAKNDLLRACGGDMVLSKRLWDQNLGHLAGEFVTPHALGTVLKMAERELEKPL